MSLETNNSVPKARYTPQDNSYDKVILEFNKKLTESAGHYDHVRHERFLILKDLADQQDIMMDKRRKRGKKNAG